MICSSPKMLSPLGSLRHIILYVGGQYADSSLKAIATASNLESLYVMGVNRPYAPGDLDLSSLCKLRAVSFWFVEPTLLLLPEHCRLTVAVGSMEGANLGSWKSVRRHVRSFWVMPMEGPPSQVGMAFGMDQLPAVLLEEGPPIQEVHLYVKSIGCSERALSLGGALAGLQVLRLVTEEGMHLMVPPDAAWQLLLLEAGKELRMEFERGPPHFQGPNSPGISASYAYLSGVGLMELFRDHPKELVVHKWLGDVRQSVIFAMRGSHRENMSMRHCSCMACKRCLEHAGKLPEDWSRMRYQHYVD